MYIFKKRKYTKDKRGQKQGTMSPYLMLGFILILISYVIIAKVLMKDNNDRIAAMSAAYYEDSKETNGDNQEQQLLTMMRNIINPSERLGRKKSQCAIYYDTLKQYLEHSDNRVTLFQSEVVRVKLLRIHEILSDEEQSDYTKLSLDGRKIVFYLLGQIYQDFGLHLHGDADGVIEKISDSNGKLLYSQDTSQPLSYFRWSALVAFIICNIILFIISFSVARKNRLFEKEENYDGFDKEKFA